MQNEPTDEHIKNEDFMKKRCVLCNTKITAGNNGFSDMLNNEERKRLMGLNKTQTVCLECKFIALALAVISPF